MTFNFISSQIDAFGEKITSINSSETVCEIKDDADIQSVLNRKVKPKTQRPQLHKVLLVNDDHTPMDFVVHVLKTLFGKENEEAMEVMLRVHHDGSGVCGIYTYEIAETKVQEVKELALKSHYPLQCIMERE
ncbi:MAG: ATP-dependent Clp protease adapter ClpS [Alphaproteobacteria bacterium]|nr:ATP-dependent Clp protease adapter ClpS [Alphaproteobacteria bacterium]